MDQRGIDAGHVHLLEAVLSRETLDLAVQARWRDNGVGPDVHLGVDDLHGELLLEFPSRPGPGGLAWPARHGHCNGLQRQCSAKGEMAWQEARVTRVSRVRSLSSAAVGQPATVLATGVPPRS